MDNKNESENGQGLDQVSKQPLHPSIVGRLDPEYIAFHNKYLQYVTPSHTLPWDPSSRDPLPPGSETLHTETKPLEVGNTADYEVSRGRAAVRVYTPEGEAPEGGWPVLLFIPGGTFVVDMYGSCIYLLGGWAYGGLDNGASFSTNMCARE